MTPRETPKLILFDIDGTLLHSGGAGRRAVQEVLEIVYNRPMPMDGFAMAGKTDLQIFHEVLGRAGLSEQEAEAGLSRVIEIFPAHLRGRIAAHQVTTCPGAREILEALRGEPQAEVALLTGNLEGGAWVKLIAAGLERFFTWGAFGTDARERSGLPPIAVERAYGRTGRRFAGQDVVIIGDTPADILCGRPIGARSIAVGTGPFPCEKLQAWAPDFCFPDLADTRAVLEAIWAPTS